jgi:hypothetical protein
MPRDLYCLGVLNPNPRPRTFSRPQLRNFNQRRRQAARSFHHNQQRSYRPLEGTEHPVEEILAPRTHPLLLNFASPNHSKINLFCTPASTATATVAIVVANLTMTALLMKFDSPACGGCLQRDKKRARK